MYNDVYDALKQVSTSNKVGGPYVPIGHTTAVGHGSSEIRGDYGAVMQTDLDALAYWLRHKHGADFLSVDGRAMAKDGNETATLVPEAKIYAMVDAWLKDKSSLPIWWVEWYALLHANAVRDPTAQAYSLDQNSDFDPQHQASLMATTLIEMATSGASVALRWAPESQDGLSRSGDQESLWSDTRDVGGGKPWPAAGVFSNFRRCFAPGVPLFAAKKSSIAIEVLASPRCTMLVNESSTQTSVTLDETRISLEPYGVAFFPLGN